MYEMKWLNVCKEKARKCLKTRVDLALMDGVGLGYEKFKRTYQMSWKVMEFKKVSKPTNVHYQCKGEGMPILSNEIAPLYVTQRA